MEKIANFTRERMPERIVHARGASAKGFFEVTHDVSHLTCADFLRAPGVQTPVIVRFSTVIHERGSPETIRDPRGFATKFYTREVYGLSFHATINLDFESIKFVFFATTCVERVLKRVLVLAKAYLVAVKFFCLVRILLDLNSCLATSKYGFSSSSVVIMVLTFSFLCWQGNFDIVGNNFPVFFIRDGIQFPDVIHAFKPNPKSHIQEYWRVLDFLSFHPESMLTFAWLFDDVGVPINYR